MTALWWAARGTGVVLLVLLTATLVLGVLTRGRARLARQPRWVTAALHRNLALVAVAFLTVHVVSSVLDPYALTGWVSVVVPFTGGYRPLWVGLGTVALDLGLAVGASGFLRRRLGERAFRAVHLGAYAVWPLALLHGLLAGTDGQARWLLALDAALVAAVAAALAWRFGRLLPAGNIGSSEPGSVIAQRAVQTEPPGHSRPAPRVEVAPR